MSPPFVATYRLQLDPSITLRDIARIVPFIARLGASHIYLAPITEARPGSAHGYDVTDHNRIREELGGEMGFRCLLQACRSAGLGIVLDFVPNHAAVGPHNAYWNDVLTYGPNSPYGRYFDIDWAPLKPELASKLLLPFLAQPYGEAIDGGLIALTVAQGHLCASYDGMWFPLRPETYAVVLGELASSAGGGPVDRLVAEINSAWTDATAAERERAEVLRQQFAGVANRLPLAPVLSSYRGEKLHKLLEAQFWRLSYWKTAGYEINYRRFFDISDLVALRMEDPEVFVSTHRLLRSLQANDAIAGVRVDHIDGLHDPACYLRWLRELGIRHIWVEKILAANEILPEDWPVDGTTGYEFLNDVARVLNWPDGELPLDRIFRRSVSGSASFEDVEHECKHLVMSTALSGELFRLAYELDGLSEADYHTRDFTLEALREALSEVIAAFGQYRTYLPGEPEISAAVIKRAVRKAQQGNLAFEPTIYDFIEQTLLFSFSALLEPTRAAWVARFQQYTAPLTAKGVEDTALYRYTRLLALNEVGGSPDRFSITPAVFCARARYRALRYPRNLLCTATHDSKQGEDARMRLVLLSELHEPFRRLVRSLDRLTARYRGQRGPSPREVYAFYQALLSRWDLAQSDGREQLEERLSSYMSKAAREAKMETSWLNPDPEYEADLRSFVRQALRDRQLPRVVGPLASEVARHGFTNTISQLVLKLTMPGIPDIYQGTELIDLSFVDPDNRRPVDYAAREELLRAMEPLLATPDLEVLRRWHRQADPRLKMYVMVRLLRFRRALPELFSGPPDLLEASGPAASHALAFLRASNGGQLVTLVTRFPALLEAKGGCEQTSLLLPPAPPGAAESWQEVLTGQSVSGDSIGLADARQALPWMVLWRRQTRAG